MSAQVEIITGRRSVAYCSLAILADPEITERPAGPRRA